MTSGENSEKVICKEEKVICKEEKDGKQNDFAGAALL